MLIGLLLLLGVAAVPLAGGRLHRLADLHLDWLPVVFAAFAIQILVVNVLPSGDEGAHAAIYIATYAAIGLVIARNIRVPGMPVIALGGLSNVLAIVANGGVMPATAAALRTAGMSPDPGVYTNSAFVPDAQLWFLGDVFAVPSWIPAANVFSIGDLLLVAGGWLLVHNVCGSPLIARRSSPRHRSGALDEQTAG